MLRLSKKADYALMAMKHLAARHDQGSCSAREIAEAYEIPLELLAKVLQRLVRARLLLSVQGTRGGYRLSRGATAIPVAEVIQAVDGPLTVTACTDHDQNCEQYSKCSIRDPLWKIRGRIVDALTTVSVADLNEEPVSAQPSVSRMNFVAVSRSGDH
jgi:Rrf2 family protein